MFDQALIDAYREEGHALPEHTSHGTEEEVANKMHSVNPRNWRQEGNRLIADTDIGPLVNFLPTDVLLTGTNDEGLPTFTKLDIK